MVIYSDDRFTLRTWQTEDAGSLAQNANDITLWNNVRDYFPHPYTVKDAEEFISFAAAKPQPLDFAVVVDGRAVGGIGFVPGVDVERFSAEIGYWLGASYRGRGIMASAVERAAEWVFSNTPIIRTFAAVYATNPSSQRVMEKAGFRYVGVICKAFFKNGAFIDGSYYELVKK